MFLGSHSPLSILCASASVSTSLSPLLFFSPLWFSYLEGLQKFLSPKLLSRFLLCAAREASTRKENSLNTSASWELAEETTEENSRVRVQICLSAPQLLSHPASLNPNLCQQKQCCCPLLSANAKKSGCVSSLLPSSASVPVLLQHWSSLKEGCIHRPLIKMPVGKCSPGIIFLCA